MGLKEVAEKIIGGGCKHIVRQTGNEITIEGASFGVPSFNFDVGKMSNKIKEFYKVSQISVALESSQYLLCDQISKLDSNSSLKDDLIRIRLQIIMAFSNLHGIVASINETSSQELTNEITDWVKFMNQLHRDSIAAIGPTGFRTRGSDEQSVKKLSSSEVDELMKYQGISKNEMDEALDFIKK